MTKTRFRPVTSSRIATMRLERYSFCPARRILESASPDIQYEGTFWIHTKVVNNAQDFRAIKYGGTSNQVASSNPPYDPQITSNQGVSSNQPYNSQFIKETPCRGTTYISNKNKNIRQCTKYTGVTRSTKLCNKNVSIATIVSWIQRCHEKIHFLALLKYCASQSKLVTLASCNKMLPLARTEPKPLPFKSYMFCSDLTWLNGS